MSEFAGAPDTKLLLAAAIFAAEDLAWRPMSNLRGSAAYHERARSHRALVDALAVLRIPDGAPADLRLLVDAMWRAGAATYSNRCGLAYYERREAVARLRGALAGWAGR